jgi:hypothetical protein
MEDSNSSNIKLSINLPLKKAWSVGQNTVVVIDKSIVKRLGISEDNTLFQQEITDKGILLRVMRL